jgi:hypothetical protein
MRKVPAPCPFCQNYSVTPGQTVAVNPQKDNLACGTRLFVDGVGTVTVTDHGDLDPRYVHQLDHYSGISACNKVGGNIGFRTTFQLL